MKFVLQFIVTHYSAQMGHSEWALLIEDAKDLQQVLNIIILHNNSDNEIRGEDIDLWAIIEYKSKLYASIHNYGGGPDTSRFLASVYHKHIFYPFKKPSDWVVEETTMSRIKWKKSDNMMNAFYIWESATKYPLKQTDKKETDKKETDKKETDKKEMDKKKTDKKETDKKKTDKKKTDKLIFNGWTEVVYSMYGYTFTYEKVCELFPDTEGHNPEPEDIEQIKSNLQKEFPKLDIAVCDFENSDHVNYTTQLAVGVITNRLEYQYNGCMKITPVSETSGKLMDEFTKKYKLENPEYFVYVDKQ